MMNNATIFVQFPPNFQFLSVCHYINIFGIFFYNNHLITLEERNHSVSVLNTLFEYLDNSTNESETKFLLLQKVLKESDLYGGGENETLDMKYVNVTYQYIISNALFSHFGYIDGYLAGIINRADNVNYSSIKQMVFQDLSENYTSTNFCSPGNKSIKLNPVTAKKVFNDHIWPMFPEPEEDMSILDVNYIYAMAGLKISRSLGNDTSTCSFQDCIFISRVLDFSEANENEIYQMVVKSYSTPALFFFAYKEKKAFQEKYQILQSNDDFWIKIYENLFSYINLTMNQLANETLFDNLYLKLEREMGNLKNRTFMATEILMKSCNFSQYDAEEYVPSYKTLNFMRNLVLPGRCRNAPHLEERFEAQFTNVSKIFNDIQKILIEKALVDGNFTDILNSNTVAENAQVENLPSDGYNPRKPHKINNDIYHLFAIKQEKKLQYYALRQENNFLTVLNRTENKQKFAEIVANETSIEMKTPLYYNPLKNYNEDHKVFVQRIADIKTSLFLKILKMEYKNPTTGEVIIDILTAFIPFYNCIDSVKSNDKAGAAISCTADILALIPAFSFVGKYSRILASSLGGGLGVKHLTIGTLARAVADNGITSLFRMSEAFFRTVTREILVKRFLKDLSVTVLRSLDPGFELFFQLNRFGFKVFQKMFEQIYRNSLSIIIKNSKFSKILAPFLNYQRTIMNVAAYHMGLVPHVLYRTSNYDFIRYTYPGGVHYVGPACVSSFGTTAQLRSVSRESFQVPVVSEKSADTMFYRPYNPKTGETSDLKYQIGENDILQPYNPHLALDGTAWKATKFMHFNPSEEWKRRIRILNNLLDSNPKAWNDVKYREDFVYPFTQEFKKQPIHSNELVEGHHLQSLVDPEARRTSGASLPSDNIPTTSKGLQRSLKAGADYTAILGQEAYDRYLNALKVFKEKGMSGIKSDKRTLSMLRKGAEVISAYQTISVRPKIPTDLWFVETIKELSIVDILKKLEGKEFYFNDIKLLTDIKPSEIIQRTRPQFSLKTEVRYHIQCDSRHGFVNLDSFDDSFKNQFLVFPERHFEVVKTEFFNRNEYLVLELKPKQIKKEQWLKIRKQQDTLLDYRDRMQSSRAKKIENAAIEKSLKTPLHTFSESEEFLKKYILKIDDTVSDVPTYDMIVRDTFAGNSVPIKYDEFQITNNIFIDDVLYQNELYNVNNLRSAEETINKIYGGTFKQKVEFLFQQYWDLPIIRQNVRFEDYCVLDSIYMGTFDNSERTLNRIKVSTYRLALRQCREELMKNPVTLYALANYKIEFFKNMVDRHIGQKFSFRTTSTLYFANKNYALKDIDNVISKRPILFQITVNNRAGIADIGRLYGTENTEFLLSPKFAVVKVGMTVDIINGRQVFVVTCHDVEEALERRMVKMANNLNQLLSTDINYYVNGIENVFGKFRETLNAHFEIPGTLTGLEKLFKKSSDYSNIFGELKCAMISDSLSKLKAQGLSGIKQEKALQELRTSLEELSILQMPEIPYRLPIDLWCTKTLDNSLHVDFLKNLQGKDFYFNDITMVTDAPDKIVPKLVSKEDVTTVRYHMQFDSQHGLINLATFDKKLKNQYIVFPEVEFYVKEAKFVKHTRILNLQLVKKPMTPADWWEIRQLEWNALNSQSKFQLSRRGDSIMNAALDISSNNPLHRFRESESHLKKYILNIDDSTSSVPTYDMLANDINSGFTIPSIQEKYSEWQITYNMFIDDVLFQNKLYQVDSLNLGTSRINKILNCYDCRQDIKPLFIKYRQSEAIRHYLTFEDHYVIRSTNENTLIQDIHALRRYDAAIYRLALRQSAEKWIKEPITLYSAFIADSKFEKLKGQIGGIRTFHQRTAFYKYDDFLPKFSSGFEKLDSSYKVIIYKTNIKDQTGTVDFFRVYGDHYNPHSLPEVIQFEEDGWTKEMINGKEYDVWTFHDIETPKETRMIKLVNKLNELFSTDTKFYVTNEDYLY